MEVISFHESDRQDLWLEEIKRSDWKPGKFLYELLNQGTFFDTVGENSKVLLLIDGNELISYCTYAQKDDIQPTELTPWMGFVYTFPEHRGHRYVGLLLKEIERLAQEEYVSQVYISTNSVGLYEKYGCEFLTEMKDLDGNPSRIYVKKVDVNENDTKEPQSKELEESIAKVDEEPGVQMLEISDQVVVVPTPISVVKEQSTQEVEVVEMLDVENDKSLVVEKSIKTSKTKKILKYLTSKKKWAILKRAFHVWQLKPHEVAPITGTTYECAACGTVFQGNYCPRCGQSASVGRFSFKKAMQHFLDVWGMGNRSMFRSLRDLVLRPGYMIRDYLSGMQSAYFPPFKMFFVFVAISLLVEHGVSFGVEEESERTFAPQTEVVQQEQQENNKHLVLSIVDKFTTKMDSLREKNPAIFSLLALMLFSWPLFFFLRKTPKIPDLRFSEFFVALVYTANTFSIFSIVGNLLDSDLLRLIAVIMVFVALHQFSGYKKRRILGYIILTLIISATVLCVVVAASLGITYLFVSK